MDALGLLKLHVGSSSEEKLVEKRSPYIDFDVQCTCYSMHKCAVLRGVKCVDFVNLIFSFCAHVLINVRCVTKQWARKTLSTVSPIHRQALRLFTFSDRFSGSADVFK